MTKNFWYFILSVFLLFLFCLAIFVFSETIFVAPIFLVLSFYFFFASILKLCKKKDKFKNRILSFLDFFFWLP